MPPQDSQWSSSKIKEKRKAGHLLHHSLAPLRRQVCRIDRLTQKCRTPEYPLGGTTDDIGVAILLKLLVQNH
ncbi:hypothetical protein E2C01_007034 [Portunus trituberculatus]|uniref:Uncharacterized protein n=1 Tax=Portunus trituberculatus TaxID=210409 RepID=A0A5B7CZD7_PORTR|nr:hypothetical protein [Portunus trituberculatus]